MRRTPLLFLRDGDHVVLIASMGGAPRHPAWLHNLRANPRVSFLGPGGASGDYVAREAGGAERGRLWDEAVDYYAGYDTYRQYYLALDFDFTAIRTRSKVLKTLIFVASCIKVPAPTLSLSRKKTSFHALYF